MAENAEKSELTSQERAVKIAEIIFESGQITTREAQEATGLSLRASRKLLNALSGILKLFYDCEERAWVRRPDG